MYNPTSSTKLANLADLRIYGGEEESAVSNRAIAHVAGPIIPGEAHSSEWRISFSMLVEDWNALRWQELHDSGNGVRGSITNGPTG